jgi:hypothetical protein
MLDLITNLKLNKRFKLKVKLSGFKDGYDIENSEGYQNAITIEHVYNPLKRKIEK